MNILLLSCGPKFSMSYMDDWEEAFLGVKGDNVIRIDVSQKYSVKQIYKDINSFNLIVGLHSFLRTSTAIREATKLASYLDRRKGIFVALVGDELNLHNAPLREKLEALALLCPDYIGTQLPIEAGKWLYDGIASRVIAIPHALNADFWKEGGIARERDIGAISVPYPIYLGDRDRNRIFEFFTNLQSVNPGKYKFTLSQRGSARLGRDEWRQFLLNHKGTVSCEAGTHYLERDDRTVREVMGYLEDKVGGEGKRVIREGALRKMFHVLPSGVKREFKKLLIQMAGGKMVGIDEITCDSRLFEDVYMRFFSSYKRLPFDTKAISSRHFEAIGTRTCQIMFPGYFNGILKGNVHYIELRDDFSNIGDVLEMFFDESFRAGVCNNALNHVLLGHTIADRIRAIKNLA